MSQARTDCRYSCGCILRISFTVPNELPCAVAHIRLVQMAKEHKRYYTPFLLEKDHPCPSCANKKRVTPLDGLSLFRGDHA